MFTGLIEEIATLQDVRTFPGGRRFRVHAPVTGPSLRAGDSVALDGACLTVEQVATEKSEFTAAAVTETLRATTASNWRRGRKLHLERALAPSGRFGGHLVQGHVDGVAPVMRAGREGDQFVLTLAIPGAVRRYVVPKGSLAVDGVSLTVGALSGEHCRIFIIPETLARTRIGAYRAGDRVNLEVDLIAKYVESLLGSRQSS